MHPPYYAADTATAVRRQCVDQLALGIKHLQFHPAEDVSLRLIVGYPGAVRRIRPLKCRAALRPSPERAQPLLDRAPRQERGFLRKDFGSQVPQRGDVVDNPYSSAMGGHHE